MNELEEYRQEIDRIDGELVKCFLERLAVTGKVGEYKQARGLPVLDPERERRVVAARTALTGDPARKADVAALYESLSDPGRRIEHRHHNTDPFTHSILRFLPLSDKSASFSLPYKFWTDTAPRSRDRTAARRSPYR